MLAADTLTKKFGARVAVEKVSFELASGNCPIVVNCGAPSLDHDEWRPYSRSTPAHSTLSLEESSSAQFTAAGSNGSGIALDSPLSGPVNAQGALADQGDNLRIKGAHDGYMADFGVSHARQLLIAPNGLLISSEDKLTAPAGLKSPDGAMIGGEYAIRFHLHPDVSASLAQNGQAVLLRLASGAGWRLRAAGGAVSLADSIYLGRRAEIRKTLQVVVTGDKRDDDAVIKWAITREAKPAKRP